MSFLLDAVTIFYFSVLKRIMQEDYSAVLPSIVKAQVLEDVTSITSREKAASKNDEASSRLNSTSHLVKRTRIS